MNISDQHFLSWQELIKAKRFLRVFLSALAIYSVLLLIAVGVYLVGTGFVKEALLALTSLFLGRAILSPLIYLLYKKSRPYQRLNFTTVYSPLLSAQTKRPNSFPSDHAVSFACVALVLWWFFPQAGIAIMLLAILNGLARIILGYHDLWDILGGWAIGIFSALVVLGFLAPRLFTS